MHVRPALPGNNRKLSAHSTLLILSQPSCTAWKITSSERKTLHFSQSHSIPKVYSPSLEVLKDFITRLSDKPTKAGAIPGLLTFLWTDERSSVCCGLIVHTFPSPRSQGKWLGHEGSTLSEDKPRRHQEQALTQTHQPAPSSWIPWTMRNKCCLRAAPFTVLLQQPTDLDYRGAQQYYCTVKSWACVADLYSYHKTLFS